ncbi:MAG: glycosyl transferase family 1, partial [Pseudomonadota bacterium]
MKILFVHQNFPGQFLHLAPELARLGHECLTLTDSANARQTTTQTLKYKHDAQAVDPSATRLGRVSSTSAMVQSP